jgi:hypothetical protein
MKAAAKFLSALSSGRLDEEALSLNPRQKLRQCGQLLSAAVSLTAVPAMSSLQVFAPCFRESASESLLVAPLARDFVSEIASSHLSPNQAPEPTRTSVTPRAAARVAPAARVAHL